MPISSRVKRAAAARTTSQPAKQRLADALSALASVPARAADRPTVSSLCRLAGVSRNTLYRYYPDMVEAVRRLRRRGGACRQTVLQNSLSTQRSELAMLRGQLAQLATLVDHYHAATEELRALLARRDRDLATLRARGQPTLARMDRSTQGSRGS